MSHAADAEGSTGGYAVVLVDLFLNLLIALQVWHAVLAEPPRQAGSTGETASITIRVAGTDRTTLGVSLEAGGRLVQASDTPVTIDSVGATVTIVEARLGRSNFEIFLIGGPFKAGDRLHVFLHDRNGTPRDAPTQFTVEIECPRPVDPSKPIVLVREQPSMSLDLDGVTDKSENRYPAKWEPTP